MGSCYIRQLGLMNAIPWFRLGVVFLHVLINGKAGQGDDGERNPGLA